MLKYTLIMHLKCLILIIILVINKKVENEQIWLFLNSSSSILPYILKMQLIHIYKLKMFLFYLENNRYHHCNCQSLEYKYQFCQVFVLKQINTIFTYK